MKRTLITILGVAGLSVLFGALAPHQPSSPAVPVAQAQGSLCVVDHGPIGGATSWCQRYASTHRVNGKACECSTVTIETDETSQLECANGFEWLIRVEVCSNGDCNPPPPSSLAVIAFNDDQSITSGVATPCGSNSYCQGGKLCFRSACSTARPVRFVVSAPGVSRIDNVDIRVACCGQLNDCYPLANP